MMPTMAATFPAPMLMVPALGLAKFALMVIRMWPSRGGSGHRCGAGRRATDLRAASTAVTPAAPAAGPMEVLRDRFALEVIDTDEKVPWWIR